MLEFLKQSTAWLAVRVVQVDIFIPRRDEEAVFVVRGELDRRNYIDWILSKLELAWDSSVLKGDICGV
jgi:hypothetical protein